MAKSFIKLLKYSNWSTILDDLRAVIIKNRTSYIKGALNDKIYMHCFGPVVKLVYTQDLKSCDSNVVWVRVPPGPLRQSRSGLARRSLSEGGE